jgi:hypothetical protein
MVDLIDFNPPPEYAPPVPPHDMDKFSPPDFMTDTGRQVYELSVNQSSTSRSCETYEATEEPLGHENHLEDDDPEVAFYRELRQQEEERRERLATRLDIR